MDLNCYVCWYRIKNSRILAEFREIDSYQTDSEDDDDDLSLNRRPTLAQSEFDNSVLRMARSLVNAAKENTITGTSNSPSITMQITRLDPSPSNPKEHDPRIAQTLEILRDMGVEVHLGERENSVLARSFEQKTIPVQKLKPSTRLNLDLSILVALVSDLTHSPLPLSPEDADARFTPSEVYLEWKKARLEATTKNGGATETIDLETLSRPSRALSNQALQEMVKGLFQEIHDCISLLQGPEDVRGTSIFPSVEFWTTPEARDRCLKIISKIGGPNEKRRAHALFYQLTAPSLSKVEAEELFWQNSRYPPGFLPLLPIRLLPDSMPGGDQDLQVFSQNGGSTHPQVLPPFFHTLAHTCRAILEHEVIPDPRTLRVLPSPNQSHKNIVPSHTADDDDNEEIQRATVTRLNPRLTAHTVQSMLWGAVNGWTTLTANRTSVKAILREVTSARFGGTPRDSLPKLSRVEDHEAGDGVDKEAEIAALWVVDPRSLAEGMRFDFKSSLNDS